MCTIEVDRPDALRDTPLTWHVADLKPGQRITLQLDVEDEAGQPWHAHAGFQSTSDGRVDLAHAAPLAGAYHTTDAMGLFWSMLPGGTRHPERAFFAWQKLTPLRYLLTVTSEGAPLAQTQLTRRGVLESDQVIRQPVHGQPFIGTFFSPATPGSYPVALVLGGSEGGLDETAAALLASHGIAALALAYFGLEGLPP